MNRSTISGFVAGAFLASAFSLGITKIIAQDEKKKDEVAPAIGDMMKKFEKVMKPGEHHKKLERMVGKWNMETRIFMGGNATPPQKGTCEVSWLMDGRWLKMESQGMMMNMPVRHFSILGYDNFKQSYVAVAVTSADTIMAYSEGDMDPSGKSLLTYGTIDEYMTGEIGKMVKSVWRFESDDRMILEIHDLPIGEHNTKVVEFTYTRQK